ncbi:hypothetical protein RUND412_004804 [Rhizina undulata]
MVQEVGLPPNKASVLTTWKLSFEELHEDARKLLCLCAFLGNDDIPHELFHRGKSAVGWIKALEVQAWTREHIDSELQLQNVEDTSMLVGSAISSYLNESRSYDDWIFERRIFSHLRASHDNISKYFKGSDNPGVSSASIAIGSAYNQLGYYKQAESLYQIALAELEKSVGKDHPETLAAVNTIASVFENQGRYDEALESYQRALTGYQRTLGKDHPLTLDVADKIAIILNELDSINVSISNITSPDIPSTHVESEVQHPVPADHVVPNPVPADVVMPNPTPADCVVPSKVPEEMINLENNHVSRGPICINESTFILTAPDIDIPTTTGSDVVENVASGIQDLFPPGGVVRDPVPEDRVVPDSVLTDHVVSNPALADFTVSSPVPEEMVTPENIDIPTDMDSGVIVNVTSETQNPVPEDRVVPTPVPDDMVTRGNLGTRLIPEQLILERLIWPVLRCLQTSFRMRTNLLEHWHRGQPSLMSVGLPPGERDPSRE